MTEIGRILIIFGLFFDLIGAICLLRMPDVYSRLLTSSKSILFGTVSILSGVFLFYGFSAAGFKIILVIGFLLLSIPVCVHVLAKGAHDAGLALGDGAVCDRYATDRQKKAQKL